MPAKARADGRRLNNYDGQAKRVSNSTVIQGVRGLASKAKRLTSKKDRNLRMKRKGKALLMLLAGFSVVLLAMTLSPGVRAQAGDPVYTSDGRLQQPQGFRHWKFIGAMAAGRASVGGWSTGCDGLHQPAESPVIATPLCRSDCSVQAGFETDEALRSAVCRRCIWTSPR